MTGPASRLTPNGLAAIGAAIGDPTRANILAALMGGQALTAGELAFRASVSPSTVSAHLARLKSTGLVVEARQGRHVYLMIASSEVAGAIEALMGLAATGDTRAQAPGPRDIQLRRARSCYDHLAGQLAVAMSDRLVQWGAIRIDHDSASLAAEGGDILRDRLGIHVAELEGRRSLCRSCLDWSERRPHLAGALGAGLMTSFLDRGWIARVTDSRAIRVTQEGRIGFRSALDLEWPAT